MPFSSYAEEDGVIWSNLGLDFYSRIDDAGDSLAQGIVMRRISEMWTYRSLGCNIPWMNSEKVDQRLLEELVSGQYWLLMHMAWSKKVTLTTQSLSSLSQCLVEKYNAIQKSAHQDQDALESIGNIGLYMDGDTSNSDYDIVADITRINAIIFKEKYDYKWTKNATAKAIASMLSGKPIASLFQWNEGTNNTWSSATNPNGSSGSTQDPNDPNKDPSLPWTGICLKWDSSWSGNIFSDGFFDDLGSTITGGWAWDGQTYTPGIISDANGSWFIDSNFGKSEAADFFHSVPCSGIFCITIDMVWGSQNLLGGFANTSIESLLEKHIKMMEPISWSDLSGQKMTNNSYQLPFLNVKIASKIAWARVYMTEAPQQTKRLKIDDTPEKKDAIFDAAFRCAMNEAGLPWESILANGFGWAGFVGLSDTMHVPTKTLPVTPQEMDSLAGCYSIRMYQWKKESYKSFSTDLNEIQGFTQAMMRIIDEILDADRILDSKPTK